MSDKYKKYVEDNVSVSSMAWKRIRKLWKGGTSKDGLRGDSHTNSYWQMGEGEYDRYKHVYGPGISPAYHARRAAEAEAAKLEPLENGGPAGIADDEELIGKKSYEYDDVYEGKYFSSDKWSFINANRKLESKRIVLLPQEWNAILHEILYTEDTQREIAKRMGKDRRKVRAAFDELRESGGALQGLELLGPTQREIFFQKVIKRKSQAQIHRTLDVTRPFVSVSIGRIEKKLRRNEQICPVFGEGVNTYFGPKTHKPVDTKEDNPAIGPFSGAKACVQEMRGVVELIYKRGVRQWWSKKDS